MVNRYPEGGGRNPELEGRIELLKSFLESADFGRLRSQSERHLLEGKTVRFVVCCEEGQLDCRMVVDEGA